MLASSRVKFIGPKSRPDLLLSLGKMSSGTEHPAERSASVGSLEISLSHGLALCLAILWIGCMPPAERPNILLIVVDTLRWDRVGVYGADRATSPAIDALAAKSIRFERAYATAPWTRPSIASMLTGLLPSAHGGWAADRALPDEAVTLPEILGDAGYSTAGVVSNFVIARRNGFAQGFASYDETGAWGYDAISTDHVTNGAIAALEAILAEPDGEDRPFFLFVHYFDPHYNYRPHDEVGFAADRAGRLDGSQSMSGLQQMEGEMTSHELAYLRDVYDEEIRHTDTGIGRLLDRLADTGRDEQTVVVFTSDHGEEFLDHGHLGHTSTLYEEVIRVPLLLRIPGTAARVVREPVSLVSITPTLLELAGVDPPRGHSFQGDSLLPLLGSSRDPSEDAPPAFEDFSFAEVDFASRLRKHKNASRKAIIGARYKLILDESTGRYELYDLKRDPLERDDLAARSPALLGALRPILKAHIQVAREKALSPETMELDAAEIELLRGLGYVEDRSGARR